MIRKQRSPLWNPPRSGPPLWPFSVNHDSVQSVDLRRWYVFGARPGGTTVFDVSNQSEATCDGTLSSGAIWQAGRDGAWAINTTSNDLIAGRSVPDTITTYTWAIWLEGTAAPGTAVNEFPFRNADSTGNFAFLWSHTSAGLKQSALHREAAGANKVAQIVSTLSGGVKYLICGTYDGTDKLKVYLDGQLEATTTGVGIQTNTPSGSLTFSKSTDRFPGLIYEFRSYARTFTDAEIYEMYDPRTRYELYARARGRAFIAIPPSPAIIPGTASLTLTTFAPIVTTPLIPATSTLRLTTFAPIVNVTAPVGVVTGSVLKVDWNDDDDFNDTGEDVTPDLLDTQDITSVRGKDQLRLLSPPMAGAFNCVINNQSRDYSVENTGSPLYSQLHPGHKLRLTITTAGTDFTLFTGPLDGIPQHPEFGNRTVEFPALGSLSKLRGKKVSTELLENVTTDVAIEAVLDAAGWPAGERIISTGQATLLYFWANDEDALDLIVSIMLTEGPGSSVVENPDGWFIFEDRHYRLVADRCTSSQFTFTDQDYIAPGCEYDPGLKDIINACDVNVTTRSVKEEEVIWQNGPPIIMGANEVRSVKAEFADPCKNIQVPDPAGGNNEVQRLAVLGTAPLIRLSYGDEQTGDITLATGTPAGAAANIETALQALTGIGSGNVDVTVVSALPDALIFNITFINDLGAQPIEALGTSAVGQTGKPVEAKLTRSTIGAVNDYYLLAGSITSITLDHTSGQTVELTITAGSSGAYVDGLQLRGQPVSVDSQKRLSNILDASASQAKYGLRSYSPSSRQEISEEEALQLADNIVRYYQDPRSIFLFSVLGIDGTIQLQQLGREISDRITITESHTGINADFFIERIGHSIRFDDSRNGTLGPLLRTQFGCEKVGNLTVGGGGGENIFRFDQGRFDVDKFGA